MSWSTAPPQTRATHESFPPEREKESNISTILPLTFKFASGFPVQLLLNLDTVEAPVDASG